VDSSPGRHSNQASGVEQEAVLDNYEIRIVKKGARAPFIYNCPQASDNDAIRCGQRLTSIDDELEVWRDLDCIYATKDLTAQVR
jgi:hypothetical protein